MYPKNFHHPYPLLHVRANRATMLGQNRKPHAIMIALPFQGHINPFVNLALKLASRDTAVTFVHLEHVHHMLSKSRPGEDKLDIFSEARRSGLDIRYMTISDGFPLEFDRDLHVMDHFNSLNRNFPSLVDKFVAKLIESMDLCFVHFLVADSVCSWPAAIARKYNLVNVSFWTEPALVFSLCYHWDIMREHGHVPGNDDKELEINYIPGIESIRIKDLMSYINEEEGLIAEHLASTFPDVKKADFILHNSVYELESETLSALSKYQPNYAIGPINFFEGPPKSSVSKSLRSESDCTRWLESKAPGSVLYVSFGSLVQVPIKEIEEIAHGLVLSGVDFIWVVRASIVSPGNTNNVLPNGYEDKIKGKGLIVSWCDQIRVLSDPAVGGFLTHNGWNSTVESMWCGVPMMCHPITWDQLTNRKLVVDDWRIGVRFWDDGAVMDREGVAEKIKGFMSGEGAEKLRREARVVKEKVRRAMEIGGSSERNFDQFVKDLKTKIQVE